MYRHILISTDGSELAQKGVDEGLQLAKALGAKVTFVTVTAPYPMASIAVGAGWVPTEEEIDVYNADEQRRADDILSAVLKAARVSGIEVQGSHVVDTLAADAILHVAAEQGCDLIVMASHGHTGVKRLLLGSQTSEVLGRATIPVLVVK